METSDTEIRRQRARGADLGIYVVRSAAQPPNLAQYARITLLTGVPFNDPVVWSGTRLKRLTAPRRVPTFKADHYTIAPLHSALISSSPSLSAAP